MFLYIRITEGGHFMKWLAMMLFSAVIMVLPFNEVHATSVKKKTTSSKKAFPK
jgi:hypothetical protein